MREIYWKFIRNMCQCGKFQATLDVEWTLNYKENKKLKYVYEICVYQEQLQIFIFSFWIPAFALCCLLLFFHINNDMFLTLLSWDFSKLPQ